MILLSQQDPDLVPGHSPVDLAYGDVQDVFFLFF